MANVDEAATPRGGARGRGRGRGRGRRGRGGAGQGRQQSHQEEQQQQQQQYQKQPQQPTSERTPKTADDSEDDSEVCFICANPIEFTSVAPCNHKSCHICALRMRALYKNKDCPHCRTPAPFVIFTADHEKNFEDYAEDDIAIPEPTVGVKYTSNDIYTQSLLFLKYNCPETTCDFQGLGWPDLHRHSKSVHHKRMCDLCSRNKKLFTHEHTLFSDKELEVHMSRGDDQPGALDQSGFKGHPRCDFCRERYYDADKLYEHCRNKHERCFLCDRDNPATPHYYRHYDDLEQHFRKDHFLCMDRECLEKKFVVFASQMDLNAHQLEEHGNTLSKDVRRDARVVDMSNFDYRQSYQPHQQQRRGGNRGRDPNADTPLPTSSAQPMRRDEVAFQRQLAIHSAQSIAPRSFGGQLSQPSSTTPVRPSRATPSQPQRQEPRQPQSQNTLQDAMGNNLGQVTDPASLSPQERARLVRHGAVIERASSLLANDEAKIARFRGHVSSYQKGGFTANQLLDAFFTLFADTSSNAIGTLVKEIVDLFERPEKKEGLLKAWQDWRAINEDYPSLPVTAPTVSSSGWAGVMTGTSSLSAPGNTGLNQRQIMKLKSSTKKGKGRTNLASIVSASGPPSGSSRQPPSSSTFPSLPKTGPNSSSAAAASMPSWTASSSQNNPGPSKVRLNNTDAFPSLPSAPKPQTTMFGINTALVKRNFGQPTETGFSWGGGSGSGSGANTPAEGTAAAEGGPSSGKGKKKGKKVKLMQFG
ncbi:hypothetical protein MKZ38_002565 [Zalerion maritima]|uniref:RING-type E3 ubiquitin transferase n=1 Tax=Zalerion maritima TaxID=339359 RepID=A0AAD5RQ99_9PEZI|nr:hypothetical protein MKZ38_002565 [Zalerion maritima]